MENAIVMTTSELAETAMLIRKHGDVHNVADIFGDWYFHPGWQFGDDGKAYYIDHSKLRDCGL